MTDETVQSLARGLVVLGSFDDRHRAMTLSEVADRTGLTRATARRILLTFESLGFVRSVGRSFSLTPRVLRFGYAYLSALGLPDVAQPVLDEVSLELGESTSVSILDGTDVVYVARTEARRIMHVAITVGTRFPAVTTSMGRVLLAGLDPAMARSIVDASPMERLTERTVTDREEMMAEIERVRARGWCVVDQELETGLVSVAVPIRSPAGTWDAALNVSMNAFALHDAAAALTTRIVPRLLAAAEQISTIRTQQR